jgi:hypothetical protein
MAAGLADAHCCNGGHHSTKVSAASGSLIVDDENLVPQAPLDGVGLLSEEACCAASGERRSAPRAGEIWRQPFQLLSTIHPTATAGRPHQHWLKYFACRSALLNERVIANSLIELGICNNLLGASVVKHACPPQKRYAKN